MSLQFQDFAAVYKLAREGVRVSSYDQSPERQMEQNQVTKLFTDKISGKDSQRPQLEAMLGFVRKGDTVVVQHGSLDAQPG